MYPLFKTSDMESFFMLILKAIMILRQIFEVKYESVKKILSSALVVAYSAKQAGQI